MTQKAKRSSDNPTAGRRRRLQALVGLLALAALAAILVLTLRDRAALEERIEVLTERAQTSESRRLVAENQLGRYTAVLNDKLDRILDLEASLRTAKIRFAKYMSQFAEPLGFIDMTDDSGPALLLVSCARILTENPQFLVGERVDPTLMSFSVRNPQIVDRLMTSGNYERVGRFRRSSERDGRPKGDMYNRKDIRPRRLFWTRTETWEEAWRGFTDHLQTFCND